MRRAVTLSSALLWLSSMAMVFGAILLDGTPPHVEPRDFAWYQDVGGWTVLVSIWTFGFAAGWEL